MECYEAEVRGLEQRVLSHPDSLGAVVFYGSSSIRLWTHLNKDFPGIRVANLGFGGATLAACAHFFDRLVIPCRPRSLIVYAGDNDLGDGETPERVAGYFASLAQQVRHGLGPIPWAFISIKPSPARWDLIERTRRANHLIRQQLEPQGSGIYIDVFGSMLDAEGRPRRELFAIDGLHLSRAGYRLWRDAVLSHHARLL